MASWTQGLRNLDDLHRLYTEEHTNMLRLARLLTGSAGLAEEAVHDAFITVYQRRASIQQPGPYLKRVVINNCHSVMRRRTLERKKIELVGRTNPNEVELPAEFEEVWSALDGLKPKQRTALVLRYHEDLALHEVAEAMGERLGTVKSLIHRALNQLRKTVDEQHPGLRPSVLGSPPESAGATTDQSITNDNTPHRATGDAQPKEDRS